MNGYFEFGDNEYSFAYSNAFTMSFIDYVSHPLFSETQSISYCSETSFNMPQFNAI